MNKFNLKKKRKFKFKMKFFKLSNIINWKMRKMIKNCKIRMFLNKV